MKHKAEDRTTGRHWPGWGECLSLTWNGGLVSGGSQTVPNFSRKFAFLSESIIGSLRLDEDQSRYLRLMIQAVAGSMRAWRAWDATTHPVPQTS